MRVYILRAHSLEQTLLDLATHLGGLRSEGSQSRANDFGSRNPLIRLGVYTFGGGHTLRAHSLEQTILALAPIRSIGSLHVRGSNFEGSSK